VPVVFDEVSASVEPEGAARPTDDAGPADGGGGDDEAGERDPRGLGRALGHRAARMARLRAD
jgi:hypothetical protein